MSDFGHTEIDQALVLTELGNKRPKDVLKTKMDAMFGIAVEPKPVHGLVSHASQW